MQTGPATTADTGMPPIQNDVLPNMINNVPTCMNHLKHVEIQNQENLSDNVCLDYNSCHCELLWAK